MANVTIMFDQHCRQHGIQHRLTTIRHPWSNGQVERIDRPVEEATVKRCHDDSHDDPLSAHLCACVHANDDARRPKTRRGLTPYDDLWTIHATEPNRSHSTQSSNHTPIILRTHSRQADGQTVFFRTSPMTAFSKTCSASNCLTDENGQKILFINCLIFRGAYQASKRAVRFRGSDASLKPRFFSTAP